VAEVQLCRAEAEGDGLPPICMQCGAPATTKVPKKYSNDSVELLPPAGPEAGLIGCLLFPLWLVIAIIKLISWSTAVTMTVRTPLCHKHSHGWFTWLSLEAKSITEERIVLCGVSEAFANAWNRRTVTEPAPAGGLVKVRCRGCQALNDERAKFCDQCGAAI
jgi:hypothetical protein